MNSVKTENQQGKPIEQPVVLLDCGQASKVTKGAVWMTLWELTPPPFDTALVW